MNIRNVFCWVARRKTNWSTHFFNAMIYRADQTRFFSYTATNEGVSLIADQHILNLFEEDALFQEQDTVPLRVIQVNLAGTNLDCCGIVRSISHPLANEAHINLLYLSTFKTANIIVRMIGEAYLLHT